MVYIDRNPMVDEVRSEVKGGGTLPPSGTSGFSWRTIVIGVLVIAVAIAAVVFGLPLLFSR
jgi:hypothetical protein